ncbi:MAG: neutral zinc metallopeptidase [bacterium]
MAHRLRLLIACWSVVIAGLVGPSLALAQQPGAAAIAASDARLRATADRLAKASVSALAEVGGRFTEPRLVGYDGSAQTACGRLPAKNAYACYADRTIYYDRSFIAGLVAWAARDLGTSGEMAGAFAIAHEWGHQIQYMLGLDYSHSGRSEADADCMAGALVRLTRSGRAMLPSEFAEVELTMQVLGDPPLIEGEWGLVVERINASKGASRTGGFTNAQGSHGNIRERLAELRRGLSSSVKTCVENIPRLTRVPVLVVPRQPLSGQAIQWYADRTADAYDFAVSQRKPLVLVTGSATGQYFRRLKSEVLDSPQLAALSTVAVFAYADPANDVVARNMAKALGYDGYPVISLFAPNANMLDERARIVGLWDAATVVAQLSKFLRKEGWMAPERAPWMPPVGSPR